MTAQNQTIRTGLIGHPVGHSLSPQIHEYWFGKYGVSGRYSLIDIKEANDLAASMRSLRDEGWRGFNVTVPYKQDVAALCDEVDGAAAATGAVNLVTITPEGRFLGKNTDAYGFIQSLKEEVPSFSFAGKAALVLGAGGAARAVCYGLKQAGIEKLYIANRTEEKAAALAANYGDTALAWAARDGAVAGGCDLVVNTTTLGLGGHESLEYDFSGIKENTIVCDIVYNPLETRFLQSARHRGCFVVGGLGMLLHQARPSFYAWTGVWPEVSGVLRKKIEGLL